MDFDIIKQHNDFTVDVSMDVSYASSVLPKPTMVEYKKVSALIQYPWIFGDCQKTFTDIWRESAVPANPNVSLGHFLWAMQTVVAMMSDWGYITILSEPGELLSQADTENKSGSRELSAEL
jgi:hypothetical protein